MVIVAFAVIIILNVVIIIVVGNIIVVTDSNGNRLTKNSDSLSPYLNKDDWHVPLDGFD